MKNYNHIYHHLFSVVLAQTTVDENDMVQCFNDQSSCTANSNGMMITAGQCCNSAGGSTRRVRVGLFCASCFSELHKSNYQNLKNMKCTKAARTKLPTQKVEAKSKYNHATFTLPITYFSFFMYYISIYPGSQLMMFNT